MYITHRQSHFQIQSMPCSNCSSHGHNIRTCPSLTPTLNSHASNNIDDDDNTVFYPVSLDFNNDDALLGMEDIAQEPQECMVCYDIVGAESVKLKCKHTYCVGCFVKHMRIANTCGFCRAEICEPPKKTQQKHISSAQICEIIEDVLDSNPEFIDTLHNDIIRQANDFMISNHKNMTTRQRSNNESIIRDILKNTDMTFGLWISGIHIGDEVAQHFMDYNNE